MILRGVLAGGRDNPLRNFPSPLAEPNHAGPLTEPKHLKKPKP
jgi:hypothetical protein